MMCGLFAFFGSSLASDELRDSFAKINHRGPDQSVFTQPNANLTLGFHRLAIMDTSTAGNQPFVGSNHKDLLVCNGEIYNSDQLKSMLPKSVHFTSSSDCEVLLPYIEHFGLLKTVQDLDAEFAFAYYNADSNTIWAARDPLGIRPLFYGRTTTSCEILFASEVKSLQDICCSIAPVPPGHYYDGQEDRFKSYRSMTKQSPRSNASESGILKDINRTLTRSVEKRLVADRDLGCLLSGGLDSSLVAAIASKSIGRKLKTFAIGCTIDPIDLKYAAEVAHYIGSDHTEVHFNPQRAIDVLEKVIYHLETWDITTIRAGIGMYLVCEAVKRDTDVKVLLTGEVSDELFGYKYTDYAPNAEAFRLEAIKRVDEIHYYDVLRADRCISGHGLEARVPFGDLEFVDVVMGIPAHMKMNHNGVGKELLRKTFAESNLLPHRILYREKAAFSDAVGHAMVDRLKQYAEVTITDQDFLISQEPHNGIIPLSKEALLYRKIFETHFPRRLGLIPAYWMPNTSWAGCNVNDPSARVLSNYGQSGS